MYLRMLMRWHLLLLLFQWPIARAMQQTASGICRVFRGHFRCHPWYGIPRAASRHDCACLKHMLSNALAVFKHDNFSSLVGRNNKRSVRIRLKKEKKRENQLTKEHTFLSLTSASGSLNGFTMVIRCLAAWGKNIATVTAASLQRQNSNDVLRSFRSVNFCLAREKLNPSLRLCVFQINTLFVSVPQIMCSPLSEGRAWKDGGKTMKRHSRTKWYNLPQSGKIRSEFLCICRPNQSQTNEKAWCGCHST